MAWIESHQELRYHVKTKRLERALGLSTPAVIGHLHMLWWWAIDHTDYGLIPRQYEALDIADGCGWPGDAEVFVSALKWAGWLDDYQDGWLFVHGWHERCGMMLKRRYKNEMKRRESVVELDEYVREKVGRLNVDQLSTSGQPHVNRMSTTGEPIGQPVGRPTGETTDHTDPIQPDITDQRARGPQADSQPRQNNHSDSETEKPKARRPDPSNKYIQAITDPVLRERTLKEAQQSWDRRYGESGHSKGAP